MHNRSSVLILALCVAPSAFAQQADSTRRATPLAAVTVTATRTARTTFDTPQPVTVLDSAQLADAVGNGIADLFPGIVGLDASGVGPNQRRPEIRGQRGQRILLLSDGLRLNNARRQQDFGELPAVAGIAAADHVEIVRGPSSVLYGTDAIGGVVNIVSRAAPLGAPEGELHGSAAYRFGGAGAASQPSVDLYGRTGRFAIRADASVREAKEYEAPDGSFGKITLPRNTPIHDSGVRDNSGRLLLDYDLGRGKNAFARAEFYSARDAGFGYIDPALLGAGQPTIQLTYPDQDYARYTLGYRATSLGLAIASRAELSSYVQSNKRHFNQHIFVPITPTANVTTNSFNFTDLRSIGGRAEMARQFGRHVLTYGVDAFQDHSDNTDTSMTTVVGFGPTSQQSSNVPSVPNATFTSAGAFAQLDVTPWDRLTVVGGVRGQTISAETRTTPNVTAPLKSGTDRTVVWSANALYRIASSLNAVASVGRGFRAPNLVERFFEGRTPEGSAYQRANATLSAESSINVDLGLRARRGIWYGESFVFRNTVDDAIKAVATGNTVGGLPEYRNQNVARLRMDGLEALAGVRTARGLGASAGYTRLIGKNISDPGSPIGDTYSSKLTGDVEYRRPNDRFVVGYSIRRQGEQKDVIVGTNPIGPVLPAFTVHSARAALRLMHRAGLSSRLVLSVDNLSNTLYAEFPNASFFRPEPGRSVSVALVNAF